MNRSSEIPWRLVVSCILFFILFSLVGWLLSTPSALADHTSNPSSVGLAGSFQDELGCPGDWQPDCAITDLTYDAGDDVWQGDYFVPGGAWEFKAALNDSWSENYGAGGVQDGPNIALTLGSDTDVSFYYDHKSHWITDNQNSVIATVPGSFQAALGCPGDWQPDCLRSWLQDLDGDGIYSFSTAAIPAGTYEAKVTIDESWNENYGVGGVQNGPNYSFNVPPSAIVTFQYDPVTHLLTITAPTGLEPGDDLLVTPPVRVPASEEVFYFVMPDRFANGDSSNDAGGDASGDPLVNGYLPTDKGFYHGGDIAGLRGQLDYLDNLGVTAIWMTPQFTNQWVQGDGTISGSSAGYHGYWQLDYTQIDPHFGTNQEMKSLIAEAHGRGMKVFFDVVINHTGDVIKYEEGEFAYRDKATYPYEDASGVIFDDRDYAGGSTFPPLDPAVSFPYTPLVIDPTAKIPAWLNNPVYYHNRGDSTFVGENSLYGDFFGLDDLFTEHPDVVDGMIQIHQQMITEFGIDGFRVDTVKHVNDELWEQWVPAILSHAASGGKPEFFLFGEVFSNDPAYAGRFSTQLPFPSVLDFGFDSAAKQFAVQSAATNSLRDFFAGDDYYTDEDSNAYSLMKFIGNHDIGRLGNAIDGTHPGATDAERVARSKLAHALMYFSRGVPLIYYGDEQGFVGDGGDKDARQDMFPSQVASYNDDDLIGTSATTADDNFDTSHSLYQAFAEMAAIRQAHPALQQGAQIHRLSQGSAGIYAFSRIDRAEQVEYLVALNNDAAATSAAINTDTPGANFIELYPGGGPSLSSDPGGALTVSVPALNLVVYRADRQVTVGATAPGVAIQTPSRGSDVAGQVEVVAAVTGASPAEVTFAVSADGGAYQVLGTDDNTPYRIFYDADQHAPGTQLTFKAIVADFRGQLNADRASVTVATPPPPSPPGTSTYAVIHYQRSDGDYGDHTTGDFNDYWGLHLWGEIEETVDWTMPKAFLGEDEYGRFAWVELQNGATDVGFIVHRGDVKDGTQSDRFFDPSVAPEIWLKQDDDNTYTSQAAAQGYVTIHYHRPDGDYGDPTSTDFNDFWGLHLWGDAIDPSEGTAWTDPKRPDGTDAYGIFWNVQLQDVTQPVNFIVHRGDLKDPGPDQSFNPEDDATVWIMSGDETIHASQGSALDYATIHYHRSDGDYGDPTSSDFNDFWGMHVWTGAANPNPSWQDPVRPLAFDNYGPVFEVDLQAGASELAYIIHRGDVKDPGPDQFLDLDKWGYEVWQLEGEGPAADEPHYVLPVFGQGGPSVPNIDVQRAYWVDEKTIVWAAANNPGFDYFLHFASDGGLTPTSTGITGGNVVELVPSVMSISATAKFPHLAGTRALRIQDAQLGLVPDILKGQIAVSAVDGNGFVVDATGLQIPGVLDDLYTYGGELGVSWADGVPTIRLWAPTAKSVVVHLFNDADPATPSVALPMVPDPDTGVWSIEGEANWIYKFYLYEVEVYVHSTGQVEHNLVTDPYSLSLAAESARSQIVDLDDPALKPPGWDSFDKPELAVPENISIYEVHVRDFSVNDPSVPDEFKGTFRAFTLDNTYGMNHLQALSDAGLSHLHLLPVFDIATIVEDRSAWLSPDPAVLATFPPTSTLQQQAVTMYEDSDGFNWGYDPFHYTVPEGSYSTNPDGATRIIEFREMVQSLNEMGLRVVMDVVYNHTSQAGQDPKSVLDRVVPGYYHRLNDQGQIETSTCCQNTASEHNMMEKLMIDSLVTWARFYKIDAFRFDLMGHHMKSNMINVRAALDALTPANDGVDGNSIYIYGEGWNFGEVADNARGENATQLNMFGQGIGTFSDRLRDAVRGGGPFDSGEDLVRRQGFANGLFYDPNALNMASVPDPEPAAVTIAGNLQDELGCPGDWQPDCAATHLAFDADDGVWQGIFTVPAGSWEYKAPLNDSWDLNYGANAQQDGPNIGLALGADTGVSFYYSNETHWVTDDVNSVIATVPGSFQDELGCPGDWQPDCLRSWLQDPDGDGTFSFTTSALPPGDYEAKVAINETWSENYGQNGVQNGPNIPFTVSDGQSVTFSYEGASHVLTISHGTISQLAELLLLTDQIRVGLAGNLANYIFVDRFGNTVTGSQVDYNGQPAGYTADPQEDITYISKHDNQTLYDNNTYKTPFNTTMADRVRIQNVGLSTVLLGQGVPFMHAGSDLLRSKSMDRDSFNSGDWFNRLDFTYQSNNFGVGLPVAGKNQTEWPIMEPFLANTDLQAGEEAIEESAALFRELLAIRYSSELFRLETFDEVQARVVFHNTGPAQIPGLIVMSISDEAGARDLDRMHESIVVIFNANDEDQNFDSADLAGLTYELHPVQMTSVDEVVTTATYDSNSGTFFVPGRTTAVFVEPASVHDKIGFLKEDVQALVDAGLLNRGQGNSLVVKLDGALEAFERGQFKVAANKISAFIHEVEALTRVGIIPQAQGDSLIFYATDLVNRLVGSG